MTVVKKGHFPKALIKTFALDEIANSSFWTGENYVVTWLCYLCTGSIPIVIYALEVFL